MSIFTFDAANREAIIKRHALGQKLIPEGVQVRMEVVDLSKNRIFRIFEVTDEKAILEANLAWSDIAQIESFPVMESEEVLEALDRTEGKAQRGIVMDHSLELASLM
jgi:glutamate formiminotransferase